MTEDADKRFNGLNLIAGIKVRKLLIELGIRTEDAECNLRGVKVILNLFAIVIVVCKFHQILTTLLVHAYYGALHASLQDWVLNSSRALCPRFFVCFSILITLLEEERAGLVCLFCACMILSFFSSSWCRGLAVVCDCGIPWTFLLTLFFIWGFYFSNFLVYFGLIFYYVY